MLLFTGSPLRSHGHRWVFFSLKGDGNTAPWSPTCQHLGVRQRDTKNYRVIDLHSQLPIQKHPKTMPKPVSISEGQDD